jgi:hypothetical protein
VKALPGNRHVRLTWTLPADADLAEVTIARSRRGVAPAVVYRGLGTSFTDRRLRNGVIYRYVLTSRDEAGNLSAGVAVSARPRVQLLRAPANGAVLSTPPVLRWAAIARATYYNVQVWRDGRKVLSRWPSATSFALRSGWFYAGTRFAFTPGSYVWYVWPGFGDRAASRYGRLLGRRSFTVPAPVPAP